MDAPSARLCRIAAIAAAVGALACVGAVALAHVVLLTTESHEPTMWGVLAWLGTLAYLGTVGAAARLARRDGGVSPATLWQLALAAQVAAMPVAWQIAEFVLARSYGRGSSLMHVVHAGGGPLLLAFLTVPAWAVLAGGDAASAGARRGRAVRASLIGGLGALALAAVVSAMYAPARLMTAAPVSGNPFLLLWELIKSVIQRSGPVQRPAMTADELMSLALLLAAVACWGTAVVVAMRDAVSLKGRLTALVPPMLIGILTLVVTTASVVERSSGFGSGLEGVALPAMAALAVLVLTAPVCVAVAALADALRHDDRAIPAPGDRRPRTADELGQILRAYILIPTAPLAILVLLTLARSC